MSKKVLILGDIHAPACDLSILEEARQFGIKEKVDKVICTGDLLDQKAWSRYPKSPDDDSPHLEWEKSKMQVKEIAKMFPKMDILNSNHDIRYLKKASEAMLTRDMVKQLHELFPYQGWNWHTPEFTEYGGFKPYIYDNVAYFHGDEKWGSTDVLFKAKDICMSVVQGHTHKASIEYYTTFKGRIFAMDVGCTVDPTNMMHMGYAANALTKVFVGFGYIDGNKVPHLFPKQLKGKK